MRFNGLLTNNKQPIEDDNFYIHVYLADNVINMNAVTKEGKIISTLLSLNIISGKVTISRSISTDLNFKLRPDGGLPTNLPVGFNQTYHELSLLLNNNEEAVKVLKSLKYHLTGE